jgi:hypothetical protein
MVVIFNVSKTITFFLKFTYLICGIPMFVKFFSYIKKVTNLLNLYMFWLYCAATIIYHLYNDIVIE